MRWMRWIAISAGVTVALTIVVFVTTLSGLLPLKFAYDLLKGRTCRVLFLDNCAPKAPLAEGRVTVTFLGASGFRIVFNGNLRNIGVAGNYEQLIEPYAEIAEGRKLGAKYRVWLTPRPPPKVIGDGSRGSVSVRMDTSGLGRSSEWANISYSIGSRSVDVGVAYRDWSPPGDGACPQGYSPTYWPVARKVIAPVVVTTLDVGSLPSDIWRGAWNKEEAKLNSSVQNAIGKLLVIGMREPVLRFGGDGGPDPWLEFSISATYESLQTLADQISPKPGFGQRRGFGELVWLLLTGDPQARLDLSRFPGRLSNRSAIGILPGGPNSFACFSGDPTDPGGGVMMPP